MLNYWSEPSLADALSDPVVKAVMTADAVNPAALSALLREAARKLTRAAHTENGAEAPAETESACAAA